MNTIKIINKIFKTDLSEKEKIRITLLGLLEVILNFYKTILKLPLFILANIFNILTTIFGMLTALFEELVLQIDLIKDIQLVSREDRRKIIEKFQKRVDKYKVI